jgi:hypothetical protein
MTENELAKRVGPVYSRAALEKMKIDPAKTALLTVAVEGQEFYPVLQFNGRNVRQDVLGIVDILAEAADSWTIAVWLRTPMAGDPQGRTFLELLDAGEFEVVVAHARDAAGRWSGGI